jgi:6-phosphogluconolactonase (cycloisomerase 2 family)
VCVWNRDGRPVRAIGGDELSNPMYIHVYQDRLFVSDLLKDALYVYHTDGQLLKCIRTVAGAEIREPCGVGVDHDGNLVLACGLSSLIGACYVLVLRQDGRLVRQIQDKRITDVLGLSLTYHGEIVLLSGGLFSNNIIVCL